jgi:hypothetical protein
VNVWTQQAVYAFIPYTKTQSQQKSGGSPMRGESTESFVQMSSLPHQYFKIARPLLSTYS